LDEVDSLPAKAQVGLLRLLQERKYRPIGSSVEHDVDFRIVSATNARLSELCADGGFRSDLYYRLAVFRIDMPPLRDRREDIPLLVEHFLRKHTPAGQAAPRVSAGGYAALAAWHWPGNVRELENSIIRGIHLRRTDLIDADDMRLPKPIRGDAPAIASPACSEIRALSALKRELVATFERDYLVQLLTQYAGNVTRAAGKAGKERRDLGRLLKKYQIDPRQFRPSDPSAQVE
jgi:DNA-binding NtrC family response regulator